MRFMFFRVTNPAVLAMVIVLGLAIVFLGSEWRRGWYRLSPDHLARECQGNLGAIALSVKRYQDAHGGTLPVNLALVGTIPTCPSARRDTYASGYAAEAGGYRVSCSGQHHRDAGLAADRPAYDSRLGFLK